MTSADRTQDTPSLAALATAAIEFSPDGVIIVDHEGKILYANSSMHRLAAATTSLVGHAVDELVPDRAREHHAALRAGYSADPEPRPMGSAQELTLRRFDGSECPVEIALSPTDIHGLHIVATVRDMTERNRIREQLALADRQLALLDERERIGRDLHDVVLQRLYGTGLTVQAIGARSNDDIRGRLDGVIDDIDRIITEVRTIVFTLGHSGRREGLGQELADVVAQSSRVLGFSPTLRLDGPVESVLGDEARVEMMASMREALGNVARHAQASTVEVSIEVRGERVVMTVADDGVGPPDTDGPIEGHGLANLTARAEALRGECELGRSAQGGATLTWWVPY